MTGESVQRHFEALLRCFYTVCVERDEARAEVERLRAEVEMLRGVGCREANADEPESGPCGVCLRCAEERGGAYELRRAADLVEDAAVAVWLRERATQIERGEV